MSYTASQLLPGETIKYQARLHWLPFAPAYLLGAVAVAGAVAGALFEVWPVAIVSALVAIPIFLWAWITLSTSEFSVTDKRVIIKVGWIRRRTLETMLGKVEGIGVEQDLMGRMFNFGTITITGTGGTREPFRNISDPLEFRRQVQSEVSAVEERRGSHDEDGAVGLLESRTRDERECPHCAEMILRKAKVCKHCQRDVEPQW